MIASKLRSWVGAGLVLLGLANAVLSISSPISTLVTFGLVLTGMAVTGYDISARTWVIEGCGRALKRAWIGVFIFFGGLFLAQYFVHAEYLFLGVLFGLVSITAGPILIASYFRCLRK